MTKGYLFGLFDLFSVGDLDIIQQASARSDQLTIGLLSDQQIAELFDRAAIIPFSERMEILRNVRGVHAVATFDFFACSDQFDVIFDDPRLARTEVDALVPPEGAVSLNLPSGTASAVLRGVLTMRSAAADVA
jgi:hypothetical protein